MAEEKKVDWTRKRDEDSRQLAKDMGNLVNDMMYNKEAFVKEFMNQHRTLQQSAFEMLFKLIDECAQEYGKGYFDLRNEQSYKVCHDIRNAIGTVRDHSTGADIFDDKWYSMRMI